MKSKRYQKLREEVAKLEERKQKILQEMEKIKAKVDLERKKKYINTLWHNAEYGSEYIYFYGIDEKGYLKSLSITCFEYNDIHIEIKPYTVSSLHGKDSNNKQYPVTRLDKKLKKVIKKIQEIASIVSDAKSLPFKKLNPNEFIL